MAQCGGEGNIDVLRGKAAVVAEREPYAEHFEGFTAAVELRRAGADARAAARGRLRLRRGWLAPAPAEPEQPREFLRTIVLGPHVQRLPAELREPFMDEVLAELGEPVVVDYVRLNIDAVA